ncbi:MAG: hypothetical protein HQK60_11715 [Deltaproteobacteria bacterium]|nr:hypothetical protein [Deltaproteobacteria bacterium]
MKILRRLVMVTSVILWAVTGSALMVWSQDKPQGIPPKSNLDEEKLKANILARIRTVPKGEASGSRTFEAVSVVIKKEVPFTLGSMEFFAVRAMLVPPIMATDQKPGVLDLIVDYTGRFRFTDIRDLVTGKILTQEPLAEAGRVKIPEGFRVVTLEGSSRHDVALVAKPTKSKLDEQRLKDNVLTRVRTVRSNGAPEAKNLGGFAVDIKNKVPFEVGSLRLFAVRMTVLQPSPAIDPKPGNLALTVDHTGRFQFSDIDELATGNSLSLAAMTEATRINIPEKLELAVFNGSGKHNVVTVSDPFCPACRKVWNQLWSRRDKLKSIKICHYPVHPGSEVACAIIKHAHAKHISPAEVANFAYTKLEQKEKPEEIIQQFFDAFPKLRKSLGDNPTAAYKTLKASYFALLTAEVNETTSLGVTSVPIVFIDGTMVIGFEEQKIVELTS